MNDKMTAMLDSMSWTGTSLKRLYDACVTSSRLSKKKKTKVAEASADEEVVQGYGDESDSSSDSSTLRKMAPKITDLRKSTERLTNCWTKLQKILKMTKIPQPRLPKS